MFDPPPRRRAVARYFLLIVVGVAVIVGLIVSASGDETRAELDYLQEMQSQAVEISKGGDALRDVVSRLQRIDRTEFVTVIDGIMEDLAVGLAFIENDPPTPSLTPVRSMYRQALRTWEDGVEGYGASVLEAADNPESLLVVDTMADSLAELRAGDTFYADLVVEMRRIDIPNPLTLGFVHRLRPVPEQRAGPSSRTRREPDRLRPRVAGRPIRPGGGSDHR